MYTKPYEQGNSLRKLAARITQLVGRRPRSTPAAPPQDTQLQPVTPTNIDKPAHNQNTVDSPPAGHICLNSRTLLAMALLSTALAAGTLIRGIHLAEKPLHHDECIYAQFAYYWYDSPGTGFYKFDPVYHGPFLYMLTRCVYELLGPGIAQARMVSAGLGITLILAPLLFARRMGRTAAAMAAAAVALSPLLCYFARFIGHDMLSLLLSAAIAAAYCRTRSEQSAQSPDALWWALITGACCGLLHATKLVSCITATVFLSYLILQRIAIGAAARSSRPPASNSDHISRNPSLDSPPDHTTTPRAGLSALAFSSPALILAALLGFLAAYSPIQTSGFHNTPAFLDGIAGSTWLHWWQMHKTERIPGPTCYHFRSLLLSEGPILIVVCTGALLVLYKRRWGRMAIAALLVLAAFTLFPIRAFKEETGWFIHALDSLLKVRSSADLFLFCLLFVTGLLGSFAYALDGQFRIAFFNYWALASLAIFSVAGEKVPWLTVHIAFPLCLAFGCVIAPWIKTTVQAWPRLTRTGKRLILTVTALIVINQARLAILDSHILCGTGRLIIDQVHTTRQARDLVPWAQSLARDRGQTNAEFPIALLGEPIWGIMFDLTTAGFRNLTFDPKTVDGSQPMVIVGATDNQSVSQLLTDKGYKHLSFPLDAWFVPEDARERTFRDWLDYAVTRKPFGVVGTRPLHVYWSADASDRSAAERH